MSDNTPGEVRPTSTLVMSSNVTPIDVRDGVTEEGPQQLPEDLQDLQDLDITLAHTDLDVEAVCDMYLISDK